MNNDDFVVSDHLQMPVKGEQKKKTFFRQFTTAANRPRDQPSADHMFLEHFNQVKFRDFTHNTRLNINSHDYLAQKIKRDRQISYWKNNVIQNFLPPISNKKKVNSNSSDMKR